MSLSIHDYRQRVYAAWLGKAIGGTLGGPHEGKESTLDLEFYDPVPDEVMPNDDFDLQIVYAEALRLLRPKAIDREFLIDCWVNHVDFPLDEYGFFKRNLSYGLRDHQLGAYDNWFSECMGGAIRSELWAALSPGDPARAAKLAWLDATLDHAENGVWAEVYLAAVQSLCFRGGEIGPILLEGLQYIPENCTLARVVRGTHERLEYGHSLERVREWILNEFPFGNFTDVIINVGFSILGLFYGGNDFEKALLAANNCGYDTDSTAATVGATLGILDPDCIPTKWSQPIGEGIVLSPEIKGIQAPETLWDLTDLVCDLRAHYAAFEPESGPVVVRRPESKASTRTPIACSLYPLEKELTDPLALSELDCCREEVLPGHWVVLEADLLGEAGVGISIELNIEAEDEYLLMVFNNARAKTYASLNESILERAPHASGHHMTGPSFHRSGENKFELGVLSPGRYRIHFLLIGEREALLGKDLVFGCGYKSSKQWLPFAFVPHGVPLPA